MYETREKMPQGHRAKQFMPFAAVKGLQEALRAKERPHILKNEIAEDAAEDLNRLLTVLRPGMRASVICSCGKECLQVCGEINCIDEIKRKLSLGGDDIAFDDIVSISVDDRTAGAEIDSFFYADP